MNTQSDSARSVQRYAAEEIKVLLVRRKSTADRLAKQLGWSPSQLSRKLANQVPLSLDDLGYIARALDVRLTELLPAETISTWTSLLQGAAA